MLVTLEHVGGAVILAEPDRVDHHLGQRRDVLETEVQSLPGHRMHHMRRIADQRQARRHEALGDLQTQRKRLQPLLQRHGPQARAHHRLDLGGNRLLRPALEFGRPRTALGPD